LLRLRSLASRILPGALEWSWFKVTSGSGLLLIRPPSPCHIERKEVEVWAVPNFSPTEPPHRSSERSSPSTPITTRQGVQGGEVIRRASSWPSALVGRWWNAKGTPGESAPPWCAGSKGPRTRTLGRRVHRGRGWPLCNGARAARRRTRRRSPGPRPAPDIPDLSV
jgi:hypothetical protein